MCLLARHRDTSTPDTSNVWLMGTRNKLCRALSHTTVPRLEAVLNHRVKLAGDLYQTQGPGTTPSFNHKVRLRGDLDHMIRPGTMTPSEKRGLEVTLRGRTSRDRQALHHVLPEGLDWNNTTTMMSCRLVELSNLSMHPIVSSVTRSEATRVPIDAITDVDLISTY
jgi:hypothetical protein